MILFMAQGVYNNSLFGEVLQSTYFIFPRMQDFLFENDSH